MIVRSDLVFACYSASCRPPTSGGTGGSNSKGGGSAVRAKDLTVGRDGTVRAGGKEVGKVTKTTKGYETTINGKTVRSKTQSGLKSGIAKQLNTPQNQIAPAVSIKDLDRLRGPIQRTPSRIKQPEVQSTKTKVDYTPRKLTKRQAQNEMDEAIRDSENHGFEPSHTEARAFVTAFRAMLYTGKEQPYFRDVDRDRPNGVVQPGDKAWHTKLDYEVAFPADTVAAWIDDPLT